MPIVFDRSTPVVSFDPTSVPVLGKWRWILWPAIAHKFLIPAPRRRVLNVFQRAVLSLCRAGTRAAPEIAKKLSLPADLVGFVLGQLHDVELLDEGSAPTARGVRLLADEEEPVDVEEAGYVFVDGHSGRLWPRFHCGSLPTIEAHFEDERSNVATFARGPVGDPKKTFATALWPRAGEHDATPPNPLDVLKAARRHRRRAQDFAREWSGAGAQDVPTLETAGREAVKRVRMIGVDPQPILVAVFFVVPDRARMRSWLVTDPCGLGVSDVLRSEAERLAAEDRCNVRGILESLVGEAWHVDPDDLADYLAEATREARENVGRRLGSAAEVLPADAVQLLARAEAKLSAAKAPDARVAKEVDDFFGHLYAALERVLGWLVSLYPDASVLAPLSSHPQENGRTMLRVAGALGFATSEIPPAVLSVPKSAVQGVMRYGNRTLPEQLVALLLAAHRHGEHPLRSLAAARPDALALLGRLRSVRIDASHDTASVPEVDEAERYRDEVFDLLRALTGKGLEEASAGAAGAKDLAWGRELMLRLRAQAERAVQTFEEVEAFSDLRARLIEMVQAALVVEHLAGAKGARAEDVSGRLRDFAVAATIVVEAAVGEIEKVAPSDPRVAAEISDDRATNAARLARAAADLGFALEAGGALPDALGRARAERIRSAAQGRRQTLSARLFAQVLTATLQPDHPLRGVARSMPSFLVETAELIDVRGHGDDVNGMKPSDAARLRRVVEDAVRAVLASVT